MRTCTRPGCSEKHHARDLCVAHYRNFMYENNPRSCRYEGCHEPHRAKGYCAGHYARLRRYGRADGTGFELRPEVVEQRRQHGRNVRASLSPEQRSAMVAKGNHSRRLKRLGQGKWAV